DDNTKIHQASSEIHRIQTDKKIVLGLFTEPSLIPNLKLPPISSTKTRSLAAQVLFPVPNKSASRSLIQKTCKNPIQFQLSQFSLPSFFQAFLPSLRHFPTGKQTNRGGGDR